MYDQAEQIKQIIDNSHRIVIIQADNPDGDSLGSALALEAILGELGKDLVMYCGVDMPTYLRYMSGWDRIEKDVPKQFDASVIVDASTMTLLERLHESGQQGWIASKPCIVLDHHDTVENVVPFATVMINDGGRASAGELIYMIAKQLGWPLPLAASEYIMTSILGDTQGLTNQLASSQTYKVMAGLVEAGVDRPKLEDLRREYSKMAPEIFRYKGDLIKRTELSAGNRIASIVIPQTEINQYSPLYNPAPLIQNDMLQTLGVQLAIVFKSYSDGRVTGAIRCNPAAPIGASLAEYLGGGGHTYASGFKIVSGRSVDDIKADCLAYATKLLDELAAA